MAAQHHTPAHPLQLPLGSNPLQQHCSLAPVLRHFPNTAAPFLLRRQRHQEYLVKIRWSDVCTVLLEHHRGGRSCYLHCTNCAPGASCSCRGAVGAPGSLHTSLLPSRDFLSPTPLTTGPRPLVCHVPPQKPLLHSCDLSLCSPALPAPVPVLSTGPGSVPGQTSPVPGLPTPEPLSLVLSRPGR